MKAVELSLISMNRGKRLTSPLQDKFRKSDDPQTSADYAFAELAFSDKFNLHGSVDHVDAARTIYLR